MSGATKGGRRRHLATLHARAWALESVDIGLSRAAFVPLTLFLSSMRHHQVLCLVCMLSACCLRFISLGFPSKHIIHSSLVKSGLWIDYNIVVNVLLVVFPDVSPINLAELYEICHLEFIRAAPRNNPLDLDIKPKRATDWQTPLGL